MPKITSGGATNGWEPGAAEDAAAVPPPPPASAPKADHVSYVADALGVPAGEAAALTKPELVELARSAAPDAQPAAPAVPPRRAPAPPQPAPAAPGPPAASESAPETPEAAESGSVPPGGM